MKIAGDGLVIIGENFNATRKIKITSPKVVQKDDKIGIGYTDLGGNTPTGNIDEKIKAYNYFDLLFSLPIKDTATFRIGVNNVFDKNPPLISQANLGGFGNGNTFPGTYDQLGRYVFVNLTADF